MEKFKNMCKTIIYDIKYGFKKIFAYISSFLDYSRKFFINKKAIVISTLLTIILFILPFTVHVGVKENKTYKDKEHVALYIQKYHCLPDNYILKSQTNKPGYQPADGKYIGGDIFEYRGEIVNHTNIRNLRECDLSYDKNDKKRGTKRLVYTVDGSEIFYTNDHYASFNKVTSWSIHHTENSWWIVFSCYVVINGQIYLYYLIYKKDEEFKMNLKDVYINKPKKLILHKKEPLQLTNKGE